MSTFPSGPAGLAILDRDGAEARDVLIYSPDKQPLVRRAIDERLTCEPQRDNYVTIRHDGVILFSALMRNESDWLAVAAQITIGHFVAARKRSSCESETRRASRSTSREERLRKRRFPWWRWVIAFRSILNPYRAVSLRVTTTCFRSRSGTTRLGAPMASRRNWKTVTRARCRPASWRDF